MKYLVIITASISALLLASTFTSCDHVEIAYPPAIELDTTLYTGNWSDYVANEWPDFDTIPNDNPSRNALIEDFTGHNCSNCPAAATDAHNIHEANPSRVFVASVHAGASTSGSTSFQDVNIAQGYTIDFTNPEGKALGALFFGIPNSGFFGNPAGTVNRVPEGTEIFYASGFWSTKVNQVLASTLKVGIKAHVNYYDATKGLYLHTEVETLDNSIDYSDLAIVAYMIEDSIVGPQNVFSTYTPDYIHRDIMRGTLSNNHLGRDVTTGKLMNDKYYIDYSYVVPNQLAPEGQTGAYNVANMHLLVYVFNKNTYEIYQVIKKYIE